MNRRYRCVAAPTLGLLILAGCQSPAPMLGEVDEADTVPATETGDAARSEHQVDASDVLLVVDVTSTHAITFYEPSPGNVTIVERRAPGERSLLPRELPLTASEVFALLRPSDDVPVSLLDADA